RGVRRAFLCTFIRFSLGILKSQQPQSPRSEPDGQPIESSQLEPYPDLKFFSKLDALLNYMCDQITSDTSSTCKTAFPPPPPVKTSSLTSPGPALARARILKPPVAPVAQILPPQSHL
ncbi:MAG: hypothetical protein WAL80_04145, partial [Xanthobacteraceae bacterium]